MRKLKLKNKLILSSLIMVIFVMVASTVVVSIIVRRQSEQISNDQIQKALNIVRNDLLERKQKILTDSRQMATTDDLGSSIKFLREYKSKAYATITNSTYKTVSNNIYQIGMTGGIWKTYVYDIDGDLISFSIQKDGESFLMGHTCGGTETSFEYAVLKPGDKLKAESWQKTTQPPDDSIELKFKDSIPNDEKLVYQESDKNLYLVAYVPAIGTDYEEGTGNPIKRQFGFVVTFLRIDKSFATKMSELTGMKINIFLKDTLIIGDIKEYNRLESGIIKDVRGEGSLLKQEILLNDIDIADEGYFQGILSLYSDSGRVGAISALLSKDIVSANTWQMIHLLSLVFIGCLLLIIPVAIFFSNSLSGSINRIINNLSDTTQQVYHASIQGSSSSNQLAEGASRQASSLEETSASLEEMSSMIKQNAEHAQEANNYTNEGVDNLKNANRSMKTLIESMGEISTASDNVSKIIKTIDEIAFQTNLLALNAAVEAARAGEAGAGFSVVADEVRNLALRAAEASKNTQEMIMEIIHNVKNGSGLVQETDDQYRKVSLSVQKIKELIGEISFASNEQAQSINQVTIAMAEMDKVTQMNATNAEKSAEASENLNEHSAIMGKIVAELVSLIRGADKRGKMDPMQPMETGEKAIEKSLKSKTFSQKIKQIRMLPIPGTKKVSPDQDNFS